MRRTFFIKISNVELLKALSNRLKGYFSVNMSLQKKLSAFIFEDFTAVVIIAIKAQQT